MSELSSEGLVRFKEVVESLSEPLAASLSEALNRPVVFDSASVSQESIGALIADSVPLVQTSFTWPALSEDEAALLVSEQDALGLVAGLDGGSEEPEKLNDAHLSHLSTVLSSLVEGMAEAIGNATQRAISTAPGISTNLEPLTLTAGFLTAGYAVQVDLSYRIEDTVTGTLRLLVTPGTARAFAQLPADEEDAAHPDDLGGGMFGGIGAPMGADPSAPFQPFQSVSNAVGAMPRGMDLILDIPLDVTVELGRVQMLIKDVLELATGSIVELERVAGEPIDLMVNGQLVAKGEVVVIEDNFGIRITEIVSPADRLSNVGRRAA